MRRSAVVIACSMLSWTAMAQGGFSGPGRYQITNVKSGKVLDLDRNDQTTVIQFSSRGTDNQTWDIQLAQGGYFYIRNVMNGKALEAGGGRNSDPLLGVPFNGRESQRWRFESGKDGNALIISRLGPTIDVPDGSNRDGLRMQVYEPNGDSNQRFILTRVAGGAGWRGGTYNQPGPAPSALITCSSASGQRVYCSADTRNGVILSRQISGSPCVRGQTWGYDNRGIWVDRGCRADFALGGAGAGYERGPYGREGRTIVCASNNGERVFCEADLRGRTPELLRQISSRPCRQNETWGWDHRGIWVDRGCRAEFALEPVR